LENKISADHRNVQSRALEAIWKEYENAQLSYRRRMVAYLLLNALPQFSNLKSIHSHQGFKDTRPAGPDVNTPLAIMFQSRKQSFHRLSKRLWDDRASMRTWSSSTGNDIVSGDYHFRPYLTQYWDLAKRAFEVVAVDSPALPKLNKLTIQGAATSGLIDLTGTPMDSLDPGNGLTQLETHYDLSKPPGVSPGFAADVRRLSQQATGFTGLTKCTFIGGAVWPDAWLDLDPLGKQNLSLPNLEELCLTRCRFSKTSAQWLRNQRIHLTLQDAQISLIDLRIFRKGSSLLSVAASGYFVVNAYSHYHGAKHIRILQSEDDLVSSICTDAWKDEWNDESWMHPRVLEKFMMLGGRTNEVFGFTKPVHDPDDFEPWKDDDDDTSDLEEESSEAELKRYQKLLR